MYSNNLPVVVVETKNASFLQEWREHPGSLTDKLQNTKSSAYLNLIAQGWVKPSWWDRYFLKIYDEYVYQREIIMQAQAVSFWYARSIIPQKCYDLNPKFFNRLKKESIKNLLFYDDRVSRINLMSYPIDSRCIEFYWVKKQVPAIKSDDILWVRYAKYSFAMQHSFYLIEILFPELESIV